MVSEVLGLLPSRSPDSRSRSTQVELLLKHLSKDFRQEASGSAGSKFTQGYMLMSRPMLSQTVGQEPLGWSQINFRWVV